MHQRCDRLRIAKTVAGGMLSSKAGSNLEYLCHEAPEATVEQLEDLVTLQEILLLLRGLLGEAATHAAVLDDLTATPASIRSSLVLTSESVQLTSSCLPQTFQILSHILRLWIYTGIMIYWVYKDWDVPGLGALKSLPLQLLLCCVLD